MDPGAALVTAYPLPPNYFGTLESHEIVAMSPPLPPVDDCSTFGTTILKHGMWTSVAEPFKVEGLQVEGKSVSIASPNQNSPNPLAELAELLKDLKGSILLNYIQLLDLLLGKNSAEAAKCLEDIKAAQQAAMYILAILQRHQSMMQLRNELGKLTNKAD